MPTTHGKHAQYQDGKHGNPLDKQQCPAIGIRKDRAKTHLSSSLKKMTHIAMGTTYLIKNIYMGKRQV